MTISDDDIQPHHSWIAKLRKLLCKGATSSFLDATIAFAFGLPFWLFGNTLKFKFKIY